MDFSALNLLWAQAFDFGFVRAPSTRRSYESDWRIFTAWCAVKELRVLPAASNTLARFITEQAREGFAPSTINRRLSAIRLVHLEARLPSWRDAIEVTAAMRTIQREWRPPPARKAAAVDEEVRRLADAVEWGYLRALRDRALVLLGFAGALRRSDLVALDVEHIDERIGYLLLRIGSGQTDYARDGDIVTILRVPGSPYCPVQALTDWRAAAQIDAGPMFRRIRRGDGLCDTRLCDKTVARVVKVLARRAGLNPSDYSSQSLRRGFLTSSARHRASIQRIADQSRHRNLDSLREYVEPTRFEQHAATGLLSSTTLSPEIAEQRIYRRSRKPVGF